MENELSELEKQTNQLDFWSDSKNSSKVLKRITELKNKVGQFKNVRSDLDNFIEIKNLLLQESDVDLEKELEVGVPKLEKEIEKLETSTLLSGKYDINNAIITLHPGAGGTEAQDWVEMLYRMYTK